MVPVAATDSGDLNREARLRNLKRGAAPTGGPGLAETKRTVKTFKDPKVAEVQKDLKRAGYNITVDGVYGPQTQLAMSKHLTALKSGAKGNVLGIKREVRESRQRVKDERSRAVRSLIPTAQPRDPSLRAKNTEQEEARMASEMAGLEPYLQESHKIGGKLLDTPDLRSAVYSKLPGMPEREFSPWWAALEAATLSPVGRPIKAGAALYRAGKAALPEAALAVKVGGSPILAQKGLKTAGTTFKREYYNPKTGLIRNLGRGVKTSMRVRSAGLHKSPARAAAIDAAEASGLSKVEVEATMRVTDELSVQAAKRGVVKSPSEFYERFQVRTSEGVESTKALFQSKPDIERGVKATLGKSGGHTWNADLKSDPGRTGFAVSVAGHETQIPVEKFDAQALIDFRASKREMFEKNPSMRVGAWRDGETVYLDLTMVMKGREEAIEFGNSQNQQAIYDRAKGEVIDLKTRLDEEALVGDDAIKRGSLAEYRQLDSAPREPGTPTEFSKAAAEDLDAYSQLARDVARTLPAEEWPAWVRNQIREQGFGSEDFGLGNQMLFQGERGATEFLDDGRAVVHLFRGSDPSTILHEFAHISRRYVLNADELGAVERTYGVQGGKWTVEAEEAFAVDFEKYILNGIAPQEGLVGAFRALRASLAQIYREFRGMKGVVPRETSEVFDSLLGGKKFVPSKAQPAGAEALLKGIKPHGPARREQDAMYSRERGERAGSAEEAYHAAGGGQAGHEAARAALRGPLRKIEMEGLQGKITQEQVNSLLDFIEHSDGLQYFERHHARDSLLSAYAGGKPLTRKEKQTLTEVFGAGVAKELDEMARGAGIKGYAADLINIPRTLSSTLDISFHGRQGLMVMVTHPGIFFKSVPKMLRAFGSEEFYQSTIREIQARPNFDRYERSGIQFTDVDGNIGKREEQFQSNIAQLLTGGKKLSPVRKSTRAYTGAANIMRADLADHLYRTADELEHDLEDDHLLKSIGTVVNSMTGRGDLGKAEGAATFLNATFFSPRLFWSRLNFLNPFYYARLHPHARKEAWHALRNLTALGSSIAIMADLSGVGEVGIDPRSADFGKVKIGNTRVDVFGGFQQPMRYLAQIISGSIVSTTTGDLLTLGPGFGKMDRFDVFLRALQSKLNPFWAYWVEAAKGEGFLGDEFSWDKSAIDKVTPILAKDVLEIVMSGDLYKPKTWKSDDRAGLGALTYGVGMWGVSLQTYGPKDPKHLTELKDAAEKYGAIPITPELETSYKVRARLDSQIKDKSYVDKLKAIVKLYGETTGDTSHEETVKGIGDNDAAAEGVYLALRGALFSEVNAWERQVEAYEEADKLRNP